MKDRKRAGRLFLGTAALLSFILVGGALPLTYALAVRPAPIGEAPGEAVLLLPLRAGEAFELRYVHSFNLFNVHEVLRYDLGLGLVAATQYVDGSGAGIGEIPGEAAFVDAGGGWQRLEGLERTLDDPIVLRVGGVADHRIVLRGREFALLEVVSELERVTIGRERVSLIQVFGSMSMLRDAPRASARPVGRSD